MSSSNKPVAKRPRSMFELLESRQLLSAVPTVAHPHLKVQPLAASSIFQGYTPSQIRHAYGFDQVAGDGAGQTIAIVDAFKDPNIAADLSVFDQNFGIAAPPSFKIVSQTGGSTDGVISDPGWSSEIALDVEWAHAIAPKANIVLVEANSDSITDLLAGVDYARKAAGVSVVSLSWGGREFGGQTRYDSLFTTPTGHQGVTFVAASGDSGAWSGPEYPSSSPNVLAVGGTTLRISSDGTYTSETGWSGSTGGVSWIENQPAYQSAAQATGGRTTPDVSYNANPNTGFAVYSSVPDGGIVGWSVIGGTSAGAPQWAAQIAIADQLRAAVGKGSLDGAIDTLPALYKLYSAPGSTSYATYTASFNDIVQGRSSNRIAAHAGYDGVTGLGSPRASQVIADLVSAGAGTTMPKAVAAPMVAKVSTQHYRSVPTGNSGAAPRAPAAATAVVPPEFAAVIDAANASAARSLANTALNLVPRFITPSPVAGAGALYRLSSFASAMPIESAPGAAPATLGGASAGQLVVRGVAGVVQSVQQTSPQVLLAAIPKFFDFGSSDSVSSFADAMANFAHESAALGLIVMPGSTHVRAWAVTFGVLGVDVILIGYWRGSGRLRRRGGAARATSTFSLMPHV
jgi:subtilase family serine protease